MNPKTYHAPSGLGKSTQAFREFGEKQNALNEALTERISTLEAENNTLYGQLSHALERIAALEERLAAQEQEQALNIRRFGRCAADLDTVEKEVERLKLTSKLNSNAIDRLMKDKE